MGRAVPRHSAREQPSNQVRRCARWVISLELEGSAAYTKHSLFYGFDDVEANGARAGTETTRCSSRPALFNKNPAIRVNVVVAHIAGEEAAVRPVPIVEDELLFRRRQSLLSKWMWL
ncbi:hypothetical protein PF008_g26030 [Phytophthora fragariae]|uniref:Uncharacterized protein n=1 Tax=Phytophthora fragariae TaxID=53985 RepID=A0A6G0QI78_9STRA|nr:hypothetical protein PF008_g26030 [Phytophthora fragariae]